MIFDETNPRHIEILREELKRAKKLMAEQETPARGTDAWATTTIASKDPTFGRVLYRGALDIMKRDEKNRQRYDRLLSQYLKNVNKATIEELTVREMENFHDLLIKFKNKITTPVMWTTDKPSALDADSYSAGQGRGGWQGD